MAIPKISNKKKLKFALTCLALLFATLHVLFPKIVVDVATLILIGIAVIPWLESIFKSVEIPGGLKLEFTDLERVGKEFKKAGLLEEKTDDKIKEEAKEETQEKDYDFLELADKNQGLALASLRIEIEKKLREIAAINKIDVGRMSMTRLIGLLSEKGVLSRSENSALLDMIRTLNQAAHGVEYDERNAEWIMEYGPQILGSLDRKTSYSGGKFSFDNPNAKEHWIDKSFRECPGKNTYEWGQCINKHTQLWEKELAKNYAELREKLRPDQKGLFEATQLNWERLNVQEKEFLNSFGDLQFKIGSGGIKIMHTTFMNKVRERALELEEMLMVLVQERE